MLLQYILMIFLPHDANYFVKCTSPSCSKVSQKHETATPMLHGWCSSACKTPPFSSKHNNGHYGQTIMFLFHQTRGHFSKKYDRCPHANRSLAFLWRFWISGLFLAERPFRLCRYSTRFYCGYRYFCACFLQHLHRSIAVVLGLICTFRTKVHSSLGDRTCLLSERYEGSVVPWLFILAYYCLYR